MPKIFDRNMTVNAVDRIFSGEPVRPSDAKMADFHESKHTVFDIPVSDIKPRTVNNYRVSEIEELAGSIDRTGLWQPIVVRKNTENDRNEIGYMIVSGERRYTAVKYLHEKYQKQGDETRAELFNTISAIILNDDELDIEESIYRDTNDYSRQLTNFERIVRLDPNTIDMTKHYWQVEFVRKCYGDDRIDDYETGKIAVRGNTQEKCQYIIAVLLEREPDLDISIKTVRNYLTFLSKCSDNLKTAALQGKVRLNDARVLCNLSFDEQSQAINSVGTPSYEAFMKKAADISAALAPISKTPANVEAKTRYADLNKKLGRSNKDLKKEASELNDMKESLNKNQKSYLNKLEQIIRLIDELTGIPIE